MAHHLANEIYKYFTDFYCDLDITKRNRSNRRPDIIIHKRGLQDFNLLVIEVKRNGTQSEIEHDRDKIKEDWFSHRLKYRFGATINLKNDKTFEVDVIKNDEMDCKKALG
ncbi:MAG: hypothetical protein ACYC6G_13820 [Desulfobaccales bacterium]